MGGTTLDVSAYNAYIPSLSLQASSLKKKLLIIV